MLGCSAAQRGGGRGLGEATASMFRRLHSRFCLHFEVSGWTFLSGSSYPVSTVQPVGGQLLP